MVKNINGDIYSDLITSYDKRAMAAGYFTRKPIDRILIHHNATTNKDVAINTWLASGAAQTSAHYEVADNELIGTVGEQTAAWHAGNADMNARSIGIEHKNATGAPSWTISEATYVTSAKLIADIARRYGFYPDSTHVIPHKHVVATACPGGIDMNKLIGMAQTFYNGGKVKPVTHSAAKHVTNIKLDQVLNPGEFFKAKPSYRVDAMKYINGIWQVVNFSLAGGKDINWTLNGLGVASVDKVDKAGKKTANQTLAVGNYFRLHSDRIKVVDVDEATNGVAFGTRYGDVWVNATTLTEVK
ncbi:N-acetylmuramoyl-L-alanine amidase [Weissella hellenica]|uniref:N-acetylmuramoyl-L-alanine amidase n=1 Tax=Weissella hellenica TaxID=46256 RepID=UPI00388760A1